MATITESQMAVYEGMIALAWADHELTADEKQGLHDLINKNHRFSDAQRQKLHADIDKRIALKEVWPRITEKIDRAHLLDMAHVIFYKDGKYCTSEKELYEEFLAHHMATLDSEQMIHEIRTMVTDFRVAREQEALDLKKYAQQFSLGNRIEAHLKQFLAQWI